MNQPAVLGRYVVGPPHCSEQLFGHKEIIRRLASRVWKALGEDRGEVRRTARLGDKRLDDAADQRVGQHCDRVVGKGEA